MTDEPVKHTWAVDKQGLYACKYCGTIWTKVNTRDDCLLQPLTPQEYTDMCGHHA